MKLSVCGACGGLLHFEATTCADCGARLGFLPGAMYLTTVGSRPDGTLEPATRPGERWHACRNAAIVGCNWMVRPDDPEGFCLACRLNRYIPDLEITGHLELWRAVECAKRRLVYALLRFGLPIEGYREKPEGGLAFDFLADTEDDHVLTGHASGVITINVAEADTVERERRRVALREPLRSLLGHMRHEVAHYYWDVLVRDSGQLQKSRKIFGDESISYTKSLKRYYKEGPPADWWERHVSEYACAHPWEDFAETWTHYLHMVDTLDTAASFGVHVDPPLPGNRRFAARVPKDPYDCPEIQDLLDAWRPVTLAVNGLNRSMGQPDLYPFRLSPVAIDKLSMIHLLIQASTHG